LISEIKHFVQFKSLCTWIALRWSNFCFNCISGTWKSNVLRQHGTSVGAVNTPMPSLHDWGKLRAHHKFWKTQILHYTWKRKFRCEKSNRM